MAGSLVIKMGMRQDVGRYLPPFKSCQNLFSGIWWTGIDQNIPQQVDIHDFQGIQRDTDETGPDFFQDSQHKLLLGRENDKLDDSCVFFEVFQFRRYSIQIYFRYLCKYKLADLFTIGFLKRLLGNLLGLL
jgi:hypothetical protein